MSEKWFSINEIYSSIFAIGELNHWEQVRSYLFIGTDSAILVDSGTGICDLSLIVRKMTDLPVKVVTTHCHWDHIGSHNRFDEVFVHEKDALWLKSGIPMPVEVIRSQLCREPFDKSLCPDFDNENYFPPKVKNPIIVEDGFVVENGLHSFMILHTPGHSPGSISLYDEKRGVLVSGDTLYRGTIYANYTSTDPTDLCKSIRRLAELDPEIILPGHNDDFLDSAILKEAEEVVIDIQNRKLDCHGTGIHGKGAVKLLF